MHSTLNVSRAQMREAEPVLKRLDQEMEMINFDPAVPSSVESATQRVMDIIDELLGGFQINRILGPLANQLKAQYVERIQHQVMSALETNVMQRC